jgi:hypothetical protein
MRTTDATSKDVFCWTVTSACAVAVNAETAAADHQTTPNNPLFILLLHV